MKFTSLFAVTTVGLLAFGSAFAQGARSDAGFVRPDPGRVVPGVEGGGSCPTPPPVTSLPFTDAGTTCGGTNTVNNYGGCPNLAFPYPGPEDVFAITFGASQSLDITADLAGSTGDLAIFVLGTCGSGDSCFTTSQDAIGPGTGPEIVPTITGRAAGTAYIYMDSYYAASNPAGCGTYTLNVAGTLPVELESFQIQ
jgi:hypothetical protein